MYVSKVLPQNTKYLNDEFRGVRFLQNLNGVSVVTGLQNTGFYNIYTGLFDKIRFEPVSKQFEISRFLNRSKVYGLKPF